MKKESIQVCRAEEVTLGKSKIFRVKNREIGIFHLQDGYYALANICPHKWAPLCKGPVSGVPQGDAPGQVQMDRVGEIIRCPWHGWEFDIKTGRSVFNPHRVRVASYDVITCSGNSKNVNCNRDDPTVDSFPVSLEDGWLYIVI